MPFRARPKYVNFLQLDEDTSPLPKVVTITRGDGGPLNLEIVNENRPGIDAVLREIEPGEQYELTIGLTPPIKAGRFRSWVRLKTGIEELPTRTVPVYATVPPGWATLAGAR